jgi:hypothetical protein
MPIKPSRDAGVILRTGNWQDFSHIYQQFKAQFEATGKATCNKLHASN